MIPPHPPETHVIQRGVHPFFEPLVSCLSGVVSLMPGHELIGHPSTPLHRASFGVMYRPARSLLFDGDDCVRAIRAGRFPDRIELLESPISRGQSPPVDPAVWLPVRLLFEATFVHYWERRRAVREQRYKAGVARPEVLRFGRIVRNAFAHNGKLDFSQDKKPRAATWRGITLGPQSDGTEVYGHFIGPGDVILLMLDLHPHM